MQAVNKKNKLDVAKMTKVSLLSAIAFVIMYIEFPLPFVPSFLKFDLSDIPALIGGFALGPAVGVTIELIKNILHIVFKGTTTSGVGELANFIVGSALVFSAAYVYKKKNTTTGALIGLVVGVITMTIVASVANYVFLIPFYAKLYGVDVNFYVDMTRSLNRYVTDFKTFILYGIVPFNLIKGILVTAITFPIYKPMSKFIKSNTN